VRDFRSAALRRHQTPKNRVLLEDYHLPGGLEAQVATFVGHYNRQRHREGLNNLTPADACHGRGQAIVLERERAKRGTIQQRRLLHQQQAA
jgi:putative transposase